MTEAKKREKKKKVFQCLDTNRPNQLTVFQSEAIPMQGIKPRAVVLTVKSGNQFIIPWDQPDCEACVEGMERAIFEKGFNIVDVDEAKKGKYAEGKLPDDQVDKELSPAQQIAELKTAAAANSEIVTQVKEAAANQAEEQSKTIEEQAATIKEMQAALANLQKDAKQKGDKQKDEAPE